MSSADVLSIAQVVRKKQEPAGIDERLMREAERFSNSLR
jgi:hypothetical protein